MRYVKNIFLDGIWTRSSIFLFLDGIWTRFSIFLKDRRKFLASP